ncbi:hypothetical protein AQUCO_04200111v1 [Aquilegia coerulea]|uniref:F-box domain-containing protein n=1 Tax=Aquilegia coerulea TaxID=218851 RepID=A0A2G5CP92_AQUCA|nr:hypothetical protein AQUCO_04200111v1 [Aquilegia coerulea]
MNKRRRREIYPSQVIRSKSFGDLPEDVMSIIFRKLGIIEVLLRTQYVCSSWLKLAKKPHVYHSVVIQHKSYDYHYHFEKFVKKAVDRSCGQLLQFSCDRPICISKGLLLYLSSQSFSSLKYLRLGSQTYVSNAVLTEAVKKLPLLEELDVWINRHHPKKLIRELGCSCPQLNYLRLNYHDEIEYTCDCKEFAITKDERESTCDCYAFAIAKELPQLLHLRLTGWVLTVNGLQAIVDGCTHLKFLDCRKCVYLGLDVDLLKICASRIANIWLPESRIIEDL